FVVPLTAAFGWSRGDAAGAASFLLIGTAITAPIIGTLIDRFGAKRVAVISMTLLAIGYGLLTQLSGNLAMFYVMWLCMSLAGGGTTPVVWTQAINLWFDKGRGLALGIALAGAGVAGVFSPRLTTALIESYGWQGGYLGIGIMLIVIAVPVIAFLFNDHAPHDHALGPETAALTPSVAHVRGGMTFQESYRTLEYWKIAIGFFFVSAIIAGIIINLVPLLIDRGLSAVAASEIAGVLGIAVLIGRVGVGYVIDHFHAPAVTRLLLIGTAIGCFLLSLNDAPTWFALVAVLSLGLAAAAEIDLVAYLVSRFFGMKAYGKIYGSQLSIFYAGAATGPLAVGKTYDLFGSYLPALYAATGILIVGGLVVGSLGKPREFTVQQQPK
ncbi:MAG: MFS transporter, partial [Planctomycetales bacterium]|nr:MFS transporter [Planctomycetales bacterium]